MKQGIGTRFYWSRSSSLDRLREAGESGHWVMSVHMPWGVRERMKLSTGSRPWSCS